MARGPSITVSILSDATKFASGVKTAEQSTSRIGSAVKKVGSVIAAGYAVDKVKDFATSSVAAARESELANRRLEAVFRATGDSTGSAAAAAEKYAESLSKRIGVQDEVIKGGQAILAGFKDVSSATARAAGVFDRATAAAADLAAKGIGSIASNSKLLGKALSDPVKGMAALKRAGVTLTAAQQAHIKSLQEQGDKIGAQKALLSALEGTTKGVAESTATSADKMKVQWDEVQEKVGNALIPVMDKLNNALTDTFDFIQGHTGLVKGLAVAFGVLGAAIAAVSIAQGISASLAAEQGVAYAAVTVATAVWSAAQWVLNAALIAGGVALNILTSPITLVVVGLAAVAAAVIYAYTHFKWFHDAVQAVWTFIKNNWPLLISIITGPLGIIVALVIKNWTTIRNTTMTVFNAIKSFLIAVWNGIRAGVMAVVNAISASIRAAWNGLKAAASAIWNGIKTAITTVWNGIKSATNSVVSFFSGIPGRIRGYFDSIGRIFSGIGDAAKTAIDTVKRWFNDIVHFFDNIVRDISTAIGKVVNAIKAPVNAIIGAWNSLAFHVPRIEIPSWVPGLGGKGFGGFDIPFPDIPKLQAGGVLTQPTTLIAGEGPATEIVAPEPLLRRIVREEGGAVTQLNVQAWDPPRVAQAIATELAYLEVRRRQR